MEPVDADNLDQKQLIRAIDLAHLQGKTVVLTMNTLLKNRELEPNCTNIWLRFTRRETCWMRLLYRIRVRWTLSKQISGGCTFMRSTR